MICARQKARRCRPTRSPSCAATWRGCSLSRSRSSEIESTRQPRLKQAPQRATHPMLLLLARLRGIGVETADNAGSRSLLSRAARSQGGGALRRHHRRPRRERQQATRKGTCARAGNARVRKGMLQLAWRWTMFQKESALTQWLSPAQRRSQRRRPQDDDHRFGAQAPDRALAMRDQRRSAGRRRAEPGDVSNSRAP